MAKLVILLVLFFLLCGCCVNYSEDIEMRPPRRCELEKIFGKGLSDADYEAKKLELSLSLGQWMTQYRKDYTVTGFREMLKWRRTRRYGMGVPELLSSENISVIAGEEKETEGWKKLIEWYKQQWPSEAARASGQQRTKAGERIERALNRTRWGKGWSLPKE